MIKFTALVKKFTVKASLSSNKSYEVIISGNDPQMKLLADSPSDQEVLISIEQPIETEGDHV